MGVFGCVLQRFGFVRVRFSPLQEIQTQIGFVPVVNPIQGRFKDRFMGWSGDPYQSVWRRSDGDSVPRLRHFMWVFALVSFSYFSLL